jgi:hypothetical protein
MVDIDLGCRCRQVTPLRIMRAGLPATTDWGGTSVVLNSALTAFTFASSRSMWGRSSDAIERRVDQAGLCGGISAGTVLCGSTG